MYLRRHAIITIVISITAACSAGDEQPLGPVAEALQDAAFAPDSFDEDEELTLAEPADIVTEVSLGEGKFVRFIDETPSRDLPSISFVVVEPDAPTSVLDIVRYAKASPLEVFLAIAPPNSAVPLALEADHLGRHLERGLPAQPRSFDQMITPVIEDDTWGPNCADEANWATGFDGYSALSVDRSHLGYVEPDDTDVYGTFLTMDYVWAGMCLYEFGISPTFVQMEAWNGAVWALVAGTYGGVPRKDRYLYYNYTATAPLRRVKVSKAGGENKFLLSGAWRESLPL